METDYLKNFISLAEIGNYSETADYLFISQSSLSKRIKRVEESLGVTLFNRTTKFLELNEFGKVYLKYAQQIIALEEACITEINNMQKGDTEKLVIGSIPSMSNYKITELISEFIQKTNTTVHIISSQSGVLEKMLLNSECDFAFIKHLKDPRHHFVKKKYTSDNLVVVVPQNHPLTNVKTISINQLRNEKFILLPEHSRPYKYCLSICKKDGFTPDVIFTDSQVDNILAFVEKGLGISLLMEKLINSDDIPNVRKINIVPNISTDITLCYNKNRPLNSVQKKFLQFMKESHRL